jgi:hypothetical protein
MTINLRVHVLGIHNMPAPISTAQEAILMPAVVLMLRVLLSAVLAVAAGAKLADRQGARRALEGFGVPASLGVSRRGRVAGV